MEEPVIEPYLFFGGRCEEAHAFYQSAIGAKVEVKMLFKESPAPMPPGVLAPGFEEKVMHSSMWVGKTRIMASDGCEPGQEYKGFTLALSVPTAAEADRAFAALSDGGKVTMPLGKTFWSEKYGMCNDRFGVSWMVMVQPPTA